MTQFGDLVRSDRERRGWNQSQLADFLGVSRQYVTLLEGGTRPRIDTAHRIAAKLGLRIQIGRHTAKRLVKWGE